MRFRVLQRGTFPAEAGQWTQAALGTAQTDPFCCAPAWQLAYHAAFGPERRVFLETAGGNVLAFAEESAGPGEVFLAPIEASWLFGCPLLGRDAVTLLAEAMVFFTEIYGPAFPKIVISGISPIGTLARLLLRAFANRFNFYVHSAGVQCAASLEGGLDGYLSRRSANHRAKLKKAAKRARDAEIAFERASPGSPEEADAVYARMLAVERGSWKGLGQCGMTEPGVVDFYAVMIRLLAASGSARVIFARNQESDIGFIFGGVAGTVYRGQQFSFMENWRSFSIGNLLQMEQIAWLCEESMRRYDMGPLDGPRMAYKNHWAEKAFPHQTWLLARL